MDQIRHPRAVLTAFLAAVTLTAGCGAPQQKVPLHASPTPARTITTPGSQALPPPVAPKDSHGGRGGPANASSAASGGLPGDWPPDLPIPAGTIMGSTGSAGRWTVLILTAGSAAEVLRSTVALYAASGFTVVTGSVLNKGNRQITLVVENQDHSATQTNLVIGVTTP